MKNWLALKKNPGLKQKLLKRELLYTTLRRFFKQTGYVEVETPILVNTPSCESNLEVFETQLRLQPEFSSRAFLITSPEYAMKKLLASGIGSCFQITKSFRNDEASSRQHNPEFSILEWYRVGADYRKIMVEFETLFLTLVRVFKRAGSGLEHFVYQGDVYDLNPPWPRYRLSELFQMHCSLSPDQLLSRDALALYARKQGFQVSRKTTWEQLFYQLYFNLIEPKLVKKGRPYFLYEYPVSQASLSKKAPDPRFAERFEVFLGTLELGNCFTELTDAKEQERRLQADLETRRRAKKNPYPLDEDLILALKQGLPETAGIAVGLDRLLMLLLDVPSIEDTLFFPVADLFSIE